MRVGVTGGAGYIGSYLVKKLVDRGHQVVSVDNLMNGDYSRLRELSLGGDAELLTGDIRDAELLEKAYSGCDAIAHLAALPGLMKCMNDPESAVSINVYGTHHVLETARKLGIGKVVFCSSAAVYGKPQRLPVVETLPLRPLNLYGVTKLAGEKLMDVFHDNHGMETVSLRFGNVYGVGLHTNYDTVIPKFVRMGLQGQDLTVYGDGAGSRDFVHVEDIAQALTLSIESKGKGGEAYNVGGETMEIGALAELVQSLIADVSEVGIVNLPPRPGETKEFSYDLKKIREGLGYEPGWSVERGVKQILAYRLENPD